VEGWQRLNFGFIPRELFYDRIEAAGKRFNHQPWSPEECIHPKIVPRDGAYTKTGLVSPIHNANSEKTRLHSLKVHFPSQSSLIFQRQNAPYECHRHRRHQYSCINCDDSPYPEGGSFCGLSVLPTTQE
jgi:hypothetical protein